MPPNVNDELDISLPLKSHVEGKEFKRRIKKRISVFVAIIHASGIYGIYQCFTGAVRWQTILLAILLYYVSALGTAAGTHRLWSHRSYRATRPLQVLLATMAAVAFQFSTITWVRDHRSHHKYSETEADPHDSRRGIFFSHIGWVISNKHPEVKRRGQAIDLSDVYNNPVLSFQHKYFIIVGGLACFILPTVTPLLWSEDLLTAWNVNLARYMLSVHAAFFINSVAHFWALGNRPYDKRIQPVQNWVVSLITCGEGFHNYHHTFPHDYSSSEFGGGVLNLTTWFIDFFAWLGWAYDLKKPSAEAIRSRAARTGDGTYESTDVKTY